MRLALLTGAVWLAAFLSPGRVCAQVLFSTGTNSGLRLWSPSGNDWWLDPSGGRLDIRANGGISPLASFLTGGNVGIGTASPSQKLHVVSASNQAAEFEVNSVNGPGGEANMMAQER